MMWRTMFLLLMFADVNATEFVNHQDITLTTTTTTMLKRPLPGTLWIISPRNGTNFTRRYPIDVVFRPIETQNKVSIQIVVNGISLGAVEASSDELKFVDIEPHTQLGQNTLSICMNMQSCTNVQFQVISNKTSVPFPIVAMDCLDNRISCHSGTFAAALQSVIPQVDALIDYSSLPFAVAHRGLRRLEPIDPTSAGWDYHRPVHDLGTGLHEWGLTHGSVLCLAASHQLGLEKIPICAEHTNKRLVFGFKMDGNKDDYPENNGLIETLSSMGLIHNHFVTQHLRSLLTSDARLSQYRILVFDRGDSNSNSLLYDGVDAYFASPGLTGDGLPQPPGSVNIEPCVSAWKHDHLFGTVVQNGRIIKEFSAEGADGEYCYEFTLDLPPGLYAFVTKFRAEKDGIVIGQCETRIRIASILGAVNLDHLVQHNIRQSRAFSVAIPKEPPVELSLEFSMNGSALIDWMYMDDSRGPEVSSDVQVQWNEEGDKILFVAAHHVNRWMGSAWRRHWYYYNAMDGYLLEAIEAFGGLQHKKLIVVGSNCPWYETIALSRGALVVSVDYHRMMYDHDNITNLVPNQLQSYVDEHGKFDVAFSLSSVEHDGLGRYGDPVSPNADIESMLHLQRLLVPGGLAFVSMPVGRDEVVWNACRVYGHIRLPKLFRGWNLLATFGLEERSFEKAGFFHHQPVFVLEN